MFSEPAVLVLRGHKFYFIHATAFIACAHFPYNFIWLIIHSCFFSKHLNIITHFTVVYIIKIYNLSPHLEKTHFNILETDLASVNSEQYPKLPFLNYHNTLLLNLWNQLLNLKILVSKNISEMLMNHAFSLSHFFLLEVKTNQYPRI